MLVSLSNIDSVMIKDVINVTYYTYVRWATKRVIVEGMLWPKIGATHYLAHLGIYTKVMQEKSWLSAVVGILVAFGPAKRSGLRLSTVRWSMNHMRMLLNNF